MIAAIDIPVDSVVLETQFVELTEIRREGARNRFQQLDRPARRRHLRRASSSRPSARAAPATAVCSGHVSSAKFQAALYAQIEGQRPDRLAPRISAQSGSTAKIITGDALPILTSIALSGVNGVSQQVQYVNVGVTLQIAPRVSGDGFVSSHVFAVVSSVTGLSQGYPTISQREAETSATVRDGDSFVIGGLTQDETINTKSKIPLLGDLPIVGQAFRNDTQHAIEDRALYRRHSAHHSPHRQPSRCRADQRSALCAAGDGQHHDHAAIASAGRAAARRSTARQRKSGGAAKAPPLLPLKPKLSSAGSRRC